MKRLVLFLFLLVIFLPVQNFGQRYRINSYGNKISIDVFSIYQSKANPLVLNSNWQNFSDSVRISLFGKGEKVRILLKEEDDYLWSSILTKKTKTTIHATVYVKEDSLIAENVEYKTKIIPAKIVSTLFIMLISISILYTILNFFILIFNNEKSGERFIQRNLSWLLTFALIALVITGFLVEPFNGTLNAIIAASIISLALFGINLGILQKGIKDGTLEPEVHYLVFVCLSLIVFSVVSIDTSVKIFLLCLANLVAFSLKDQVS